MHITTRSALLCVAVLTSACAASDDPPARTDAAALGRVHFETTCDDAVAADFDRGVALLHSFWFRAAIETFEEVLGADPGCAMAEWGIAMAHWSNPLLSNRRPEPLARGAAAVERARAIGTEDAREAAYIDAVAELYRDYEQSDDKSRARVFEAKMEALVSAHPDDTEAAIFYAMALNGTADPADKSYAQQLRAAAILERSFDTQPEHPGIAHYLIHTYDVPSLANRALEAAQAYAGIAPEAPHALHMPSHTFTRLGYWQESIDTNARSADAALDAGSPPEALHALDYMVYAYLQTGRDGDAAAVVERADGVALLVDWDGPYAIAAAYAIAAIPARYALERGDWAAAAALPRYESPVAFVDAIVLFARGLGAARSGDAVAAREAVAALETARDQLPEESYWAGQVEIQRTAVLAWAEFAEGDGERALATMERAVALEEATEKSAVSPGPIAPARELHGEMLLERGRPEEALAAFQATLVKEPGRFRGLEGALRAAEGSGDAERARQYTRDLVALCEPASGAVRPELQRAREQL